jgi:hypothetical protein
MVTDNVPSPDSAEAAPTVLESLYAYVQSGIYEEPNAHDVAAAGGARVYQAKESSSEDRNIRAPRIPAIRCPVQIADGEVCVSLQCDEGAKAASTPGRDAAARAGPAASCAPQLLPSVLPRPVGAGPALTPPPPARQHCCAGCSPYQQLWRLFHAHARR